MGKRKRRTFTPEQRTEAVNIVFDTGKTISAVARDLDLTVSALSSWVKQAKNDQGRGAPGALTTAEKKEMSEMKREVKQLRQENAFLKKASAFFAKESL